MPPFKSEAQKRKFQLLVKQGKMSKTTYDEWASASKGKRLPERAPKPNKVTYVKKIKVS